MKTLLITSVRSFTATVYNVKMLTFIAVVCFLNAASAGIKPAGNISSVATLNSLTFNPAITRTTVSGPNFRDYTATVPGYVSSIKVIPVATDPAATITVNGTPVASGASSAAISLNVGSNTIVTKVTASDGVTFNNYSITITRQPPPVVTLNSLRFSPAITTTTVAGPNFRDYTATVTNDVNSVTVTPTVTDPAATVKVNGTAVASGTASGPITLNVGNNTITTVVTGSDGVTTATYSTVITRQGNAMLSSLTFTPDLERTTVPGPDFRDYTATVGNYISSVRVTPVTVDPAATVKVNGTTVASGASSSPIGLAVGSNTIVIKVTSVDNLINTYKITITRQGTAVATLNSLRFNPAITRTTVPGPHFKDYTATVPNTISTIKVKPVVTDPASTVTVNGVVTASGAESTPIALTEGDNVIRTVVTAADGLTFNVYNTVITRQGPNALLAALRVANQELVPVTGPHFRDYTLTVPNDLPVILIQAQVQDPAATIKIVIPGQAHDPAQNYVSLNVGQTVIDVVVTAADNVTTNTYEITATRLPPLPPVLQSLIISPSITLTQVSGPDYKDYTASVDSSIGDIFITPVVVDPFSLSIEINGTAVASRDRYHFFVQPGTNVITIKVTAKDHITSNTYRITITKPNVLSLADGSPSLFTDDGGGIGLEHGTGANEYVAFAPSAISRPLLYVATEDRTATLKINGQPGFNPNTYSAYINLSTGINIYRIVVTSANGLDSAVYKITITHQQAGYDATMTAVRFTPSIGERAVPGTHFQDYVGTVGNAVTSVQAYVWLDDPASTLKINGVTTANKTNSAPISLSVGANTITFEITSVNGLNTETHTTTITRAAAGPAAGLATTNTPETGASVANNAVVVHGNLSPNNDGIGDRLMIDGITAYPDNKLSIIDKSGALVYQVKGYDNVNRVFDGSSNITGRLQHTGTYFYSLDYKASGKLIHKTGYIIIKY